MGIKHLTTHLDFPIPLWYYLPMNKTLVKVRRLLPNFFVFFKHDNILAISTDKNEAPFCYLIADERHPSHLLMSMAIDYAHSEHFVEIAILANKIMPIAISDKFYLSESLGQTFIGEEADKVYTFDNELPLEMLDPESKTLH